MANFVVENVTPDGNGLTHLRQLRADGVSLHEAPDGTLSVPVLPGQGLRHQFFVPAASQTVFALGAAAGPTVLVFVNGMLLAPSFFSVGATAVTLALPFALDGDDTVDVLY